jgi:crotonobetainyl-CoA:carnitine CoA-transferase CaiB-like acyl-CoA transferase
MNSFLSSLKVLEVSSVLAGPAVGMYFAEKGAQVVKLENKTTGGDVTRSWKLSTEDKSSSTSAYFAAVNWHKEHHLLDFKDEESKVFMRSLIKESDVVITNFKKGDAEKFKLDFNSLKELNENIILAEISGYGSESDRVAFDLVLQADTGFMSMNGTKDSGPVKMPVAFIDLFAAHQLKEGILEALLERSINGGAYLVRVSLYDAAVSSLANQATNFLIANKVAERIGSKHPNIAPYGEIFETSDGKSITFAIGSDKQFQSLCTYLGLDLHHNFNSNPLRVENRLQIEREIANKVKQFSSSNLENDLIKERVPVAIIKSLDQVLDSTEAKKLLLSDELGERVKTVVYKIDRS